jgi:hypothetical protein
MFQTYTLHFDMSEPRRSDRKRAATDFLGAKSSEALQSSSKEAKEAARLADEAAVASAYDRLVGLVQLGQAGGGGGRVWAGSDGSPALPAFAPLPNDRQRLAVAPLPWHLYLSRWRAAGQLGKQLLELAVSWFREPLRAAGLGAVRFKVVVRDDADEAAAAAAASEPASSISTPSARTCSTMAGGQGEAGGPPLPPQPRALRPCSRSTSASRQPATISTAGSFTSPSTSTATAACSSLAAPLTETSSRRTAKSGAARAATRCMVWASTVASTTSSRPPRAPTTAAVAAPAALREVGALWGFNAVGYWAAGLERNRIVAQQPQTRLQPSLTLAGGAAAALATERPGHAGPERG